MGIPVRNSVAVFLIGVAFVFVERGSPQDPESALRKDHPLLEMDLSKLGYRIFEGEKRLPTFVDFTDIDRLAVAWLTLDARPVAKKTGPRTPEPAHLHVFVLDARTGQKQGLQEWSTPSYPVHFLGLDDGKFLVCTGKRNSSVLAQLRDYSRTASAKFP